jgi:hypothetical protein
MSLVSPLIAFALRQVIGDSADTVVGAVERYFTDRGRALPRALHKANESAWQAIALALAGDGFFDAVSTSVGARSPDHVPVADEGLPLSSPEETSGRGQGHGRETGPQRRDGMN